MKTISKSKLLSLLVILAIMTGSMSVTMLQVSANAQANKLVSVAESQIGYKTLSNGTTKYGTWYGIPKGAWCAMFVSWCANQAGISTSIVPKHADYDVGKIGSKVEVYGKTANHKVVHTLLKRRYNIF